MSLFLCFTASLGLVASTQALQAFCGFAGVVVQGFSVMRRPCIPSRTLTYALCAAVLLVSQAMM